MTIITTMTSVVDFPRAYQNHAPSAYTCSDGDDDDTPTVSHHKPVARTWVRRPTVIRRRHFPRRARGTVLDTDALCAIVGRDAARAGLVATVESVRVLFPLSVWRKPNRRADNGSNRGATVKIAARTHVYIYLFILRYTCVRRSFCLRRWCKRNNDNTTHHEWYNIYYLWTTE